MDADANRKSHGENSPGDATKTIETRLDVAEPMEFRIIPNFLPPPDRLIFKEDGIKVTITLSTKSVYFFKTEAEKRGLQYQRMIRRLLDAYVEAFEPSIKEAAQESKRNRVEQPRGSYRKARKR